MNPNNNFNQEEIKAHNKDNEDDLDQERVKEDNIGNKNDPNHEEVKEENIDNTKNFNQEENGLNHEKTNKEAIKGLQMSKKNFASKELLFFSDQITSITPNNFESFMIQLYNIKSKENVYAYKFDNLNEAIKYDKQFDFNFFSSMLPFIFQLASESYENFNFPKVLKQQENKEISFTKYQIAGIMAQLFFGLIPNRKETNLPETVNFLSLFTRQNDLKVQKLLCILNYFKTIKKWEENEKEKLKEIVIYSRKVEYQIKNAKHWNASTEKSLDYEIIRQGTMEEQQFKKAIIVDFANKLVGGGVLKSGAVQEEILFMICPECIPSLYFFEEFEDNEVGFITGADRINKIQGYKKNFQFIGDFPQNLSPSMNKPQEMIIAILDALDFNEVQSPEYAAENLERELNKAFLAFSSHDNFQNVVTGKWGCGIFGGTPILKFIIQWIAASECRKSMKFCTMNDIAFQKDEILLEKIMNSGKDVGNLSQLIFGYGKFANKFSFHDYLMNNL